MLTEKIHLEPDEVILAQVRKHWFILFTRMAGLGITAFLPIVAYGVITQIFPARTLPIELNIPALTGLYAGWLLLTWMALFTVWTNYYLDVWTITNKRLIAVDQRGLFHRHIGSFRLERLQDMNASIHGIIATFLNFGTLEAQTASGDDGFKATGLPQPQELKALILRAADETSFNPTQTTSTTQSEV